MIENEKIVFVYKTSIQNEETAKIVKEKLSRLIGILRVNFDLEDIDNILRIEASQNISEKIIQNLREINLSCQELE